jgi:hypothetical protein
MKAIITAALLALTVTTAARAQNATPLTLSCTGTLTDSLANKVAKLRIGLIVNFQTKQVIGLGDGWEADIVAVGEAQIDFLRYFGTDESMTFIEGTIDRVTGFASASVAVSSIQRDRTFKTITSLSFDLLCNPAQ